MKISPCNWSVAIVGQWNTAIFTPNIVAEKIFNLPTGSPIAVEVALDAVSPYRIKHSQHSLVFMARRDRLEIEVADNQIQTLQKSMEIAKNCLDWLRNTPVEAAGFNLRYKMDELGDACDKLVNIDADSRFSDAGIPIVNRAFHRCFEFNAGQLNFEVSTDSDANVFVLLNFHRSSRSPDDLIAWLEQPIDGVTQEVKKIFAAAFPDFSEGDLNVNDKTATSCGTA